MMPHYLGGVEVQIPHSASVDMVHGEVAEWFLITAGWERVHTYY